MTEYDFRAKEYVENLVKQEMTLMDKSSPIYDNSNYAFEFDFNRHASSVQFAQYEYNRLCEQEARGEEQTGNTFDGSRYQLKEPSPENKDSVEAWKVSIQHACVQFELQKKR